MIVVRGTFQARYGRGDELVQIFKEASAIWPSGRNARLLTDLSGPFFTVVSEAEYDSFDAWQADAEAIFGDQRFAALFERMMPLVESGRRDFYNLVE
jgi:hypothetical protein